MIFKSLSFPTFEQLKIFQTKIDLLLKRRYSRGAKCSVGIADGIKLPSISSNFAPIKGTFVRAQTKRSSEKEQRTNLEKRKDLVSFFSLNFNKMSTKIHFFKS